VVTTHPMLLSSDGFESSSEWKDKAYHLEKIGRDVVYIYFNCQAEIDSNLTLKEWTEYLATEKHMDGFGAYTLGIANGLL
jgi:hypothetical protein